MRVKVTEAGRAYYNYGIVELAEGQELDGELALYLLTVGAGVAPDDEAARSELERLETVRSGVQQEAEAEPPAPPAELDIDAKADDVLAWVGDNPARAAEALELERAKEKPRSTLVKQLAKLAGSDE